jgi:hypothetical protein
MSANPLEDLRAMFRSNIFELEDMLKAAPQPLL